MKRRTFLPILAAAALPGRAQSNEQMNFLTGLPDGRRLNEMLPAHVNSKAFTLLDQRREAVANLATPADLEARRRYVRQKMIESIGELPERTPLNARVVGTLDRGDHRVEKVIFESQPKFYVTANLYLPASGRAPYPAILFPLGHEQGAKAHSAWQSVLVSMARKGFVCLAWDPVGQGERIQLWDDDFQDSKVVRSTTEHTILGVQSILLGDTLARYTIWDGIRALDYLLSRPEVDPKRIGVTGNSGGGTHTAYLAAIDDRIHVAAPSCYITSWRRLIETIGPQDAEQCFPGWLAAGLDHGDFVLAFAPKPYMMLTAIRDFFSITGARETFQESRAVFERIGAGDRMQMFEADDGHGYTLPRRLAGYRWFRKHLQGVDEEAVEPEVVEAPERELWCTPTGQVATSLGGETVSSLQVKRLEQVRRKSGAATVEEIERLTGYRRRQGPVKLHAYGSTDAGGGLTIEKLVYESEPGILIPSVLYLPAGGGRKPAAIVVDGQGKLSARARMQQLARAGLVVLGIDARGWGQTSAAGDRGGSDWPRYFGDFHSAMTALLNGDSLVGMRALDVARGVDLLAVRADVDASRVYGFGIGNGAVPMLHAAAFDRRLAKIAMENMLVSYEAVVRHKIHRGGIFENVVRGALRHYDLPDLVRLIAPRPVWIVEAQDPVGRAVAVQEVSKLYARSGVTVAHRKPSDTAASLYGAMWR
jgi:cephalosporin-C deacetylase-like acetyl esterase